MNTRPLSDIIMPDAPFTDDELIDALAYDGVDMAADDQEKAAATTTTTLRWKPTSDRSAEWTLRKLIEKRTAIAAKAAEAQEMRMSLLSELTRVDEWEDKQTRTLRSGERHFDFLLQEWAMGQRTDRNKSFLLPSGVINTKDKRPAVEKVKGRAADEAAVEWAESRGVEVNEKTEKSVDLTALKPKVRIVDHLTKVYTGIGDMSDPAAWEWAPHIIADMVEVPPPVHDEDAPSTMSWRFTDTTTGANIDTAIVADGPFVVDDETGLPLDFLAVRAGGLSAEVVVTALD